MAADIEQRAKPAILTVDDDEGFLEDFDGEVIAGLGCLTAVPDAMPVALEEALELALEEGGVAIKRPAESVAGAVRRDRPGNGIGIHVAPLY
jgi:hypothetical protein